MFVQVWRSLAIAGACGLSLAALPATSDDRTLLPRLIGTGERQAADPVSGIALAGLDPVSYQLDPSPRPGLPAYEVARDGQAWRFASEANRVAFLHDPAAFRPRIGGYDALGATRGRVVDADPRVFLLRSGRLYLFRDRESRRAFLADPSLVVRAEAGWLRLESNLVRD